MTNQHKGNDIHIFPSNILLRFRKRVIESFFLNVFGTLSLFLMHSILGRLLGPKEYGAFSYTLTIAGILSIIVPLGWPVGLMRLLAKYKEEKKWNLYRGAFSAAHRITLFSSLLTASLMFIVSFCFSDNNELRLCLRMSAVILPVIAFVDLRKRCLQAVNKIKSCIAFDQIFLPITVIGVSLAISVANAKAAIGIYGACALGIFVIASWWLWKHLPAEARSASPSYRIASWMKIVVPMMLGGISQLVLYRAGLVILGTMADMKEVGLYSAAMRLANINTFVLTAINTVVAPMLSTRYQAHNIKEFHFIRKKAMLWSMMGSLPLFFTIMLIPKYIMMIFGSEYTEGWLLLQILSIGQFINASAGPVGFSLLMSNNERIYAVSMAIIAVVNIVLLLILTPLMGSIGVAIACSASVIALSIWQLLLSIRITR